MEFPGTKPAQAGNLEIPAECRAWRWSTKYPHAVAVQFFMRNQMRQKSLWAAAYQISHRRLSMIDRSAIARVLELIQKHAAAPCFRSADPCLQGLTTLPVALSFIGT